MNTNFITMKKRQLVLFLLCSIMMGTIGAQELRKYQWKNRIVLIISKDSLSKIYKAQIKEFESDRNGFENRKLLVYHVLPNTHKMIKKHNTRWQTNSGLYDTYNPHNENFKCILIGLDGGVKIEQNELLTKKELFSSIDGMPMRRSELKNKN